MNQLYNELVANTVKYMDNGLIDISPPNSLSLRAARAIQQLTGQVEAITTTSFSLQRELTQLTEIYNTLKELNVKLEQSGANLVPNAESVCESGEQTSDVGDGKRNDCDGNYFS